MSQSTQQRTRFLWLVLVVVGANYVAQIPYYLDVYLSHMRRRPL